MSSLVEQAKQSRRKTVYEITPEVVELAVAWAKDEITITQARKALGIAENNQVYSVLARALKEKIRSSLIGEKKPTRENEKIITEETHEQKTIKDNHDGAVDAPDSY